jgi:hypothetical protein
MQAITEKCEHILVTSSFIINAEYVHQRNPYRILVGKPEEKYHWEDQDVGGWTILKWILERWDGMVWIGLNWLRIGTSGGLLRTW